MTVGQVGSGGIVGCPVNFDQDGWGQGSAAEVGGTVRRRLVEAKGRD